MREGGAREWEPSLPRERKQVQGKLNLTPLSLEWSQVQGKFEMGGQLWPRQFVAGFPIAGDLAEPGVYLVKNCEMAELAPEQLLNDPTWRIETCVASVARPHE